jgi:hypothetical protein
MKLFITRFFVYSILGVVVILPFPSFLLYEKRMHLSHKILSFFDRTLNVQSDGKGIWILCAYALFLGIIISALLPFILKERWKYDYKSLLYVLSSYVLAFFLLKYGFDKVFKHQFYYPEPAILHTPLGKLDRDILYWSTMGKSYSYSVFTGFLEIIPAFLLLSRNFRLLGSVLAFGVFTHVFAINIGFDIQVKFLAGFLLVLSALNCWINRHALMNLFLQNCTFPIRITQSFLNQSRKQRIVKSFIVCCFLFDCLAPYVLSENFNDDKAKRPFLHGAYEILDTNSDSSSLLGELNSYQKAFFHRKSYLIFQKKNFDLLDLQIHVSRHNKTILLNQGNQLQKINFELKNDTLRLNWVEKQQLKTIVLKKVND